MTMQVRSIGLDEDARWDEFVMSCQESTFFHLAGWRTVLEESFGHRCHFLVAEENDEIQGVLPLAQVKSFFFGNSLSSLPFCVYGGILALSEEAREALRKAACTLAETLNVDALQLRNSHASGSDWPSSDLYYTFRKEIVADNEVNLKAIPNRQRAMVRKGIKYGLVSEESDSSERIYRVYSESVRNLGTPVFSKKYFDVLQKVFGKDCRILMIRDGDEDVAGVMSFYFKGEVLPYYGGGIARARSIPGCNHFMYWELMRRSADEGITGFDFGRSKAGTGPYSFKKNWGFTPQPLAYEYYLVRSNEIPNVNPTNPKYRMLIEIWSRLPLPVANFIGPMLAKDLG
ncbi:MAG: FemAB family PEP-CTERM system-associated protein [Desulfobacterales bacterium]|nr:FemAB family PEP-CTERM system-associated protein [Desulfobacterales bacterium]